MREPEAINRRFDVLSHRSNVPKYCVAAPPLHTPPQNGKTPPQALKQRAGRRTLFFFDVPVRPARAILPSRLARLMFRPIVVGRRVLGFSSRQRYRRARRLPRFAVLSGSSSRIKVTPRYVAAPAPHWRCASPLCLTLRIQRRQRLDEPSQGAQREEAPIPESKYCLTSLKNVIGAPGDTTRDAVSATNGCQQAVRA